MWKVGVIIKERGRKEPGGVRLREASAGGRGRTLRAGAGMGPEVPCAGKAPAEMGGCQGMGEVGDGKFCNSR